MEYLFYIKALHIISFVGWFAALFYGVRLLIYHTEANSLPDNERKVLQAQYTIMEQRLWKYIATPAFIATWVFGLWLLMVQMDFMKEGWMHTKLTLVLLLTGYHHIIQSRMKKIGKGDFSWSAKKLRIWNQGASVFLIGIVFLVETKTKTDWLLAVAGLIVVITLIFSLRKKD